MSIIGSGSHNRNHDKISSKRDFSTDLRERAAAASQQSSSGNKTTAASWRNAKLLTRKRRCYHVRDEVGMFLVSSLEGVVCRRDWPKYYWVRGRQWLWSDVSGSYCQQIQLCQHIRLSARRNGPVLTDAACKFLRSCTHTHRGRRNQLTWIYLFYFLCKDRWCSAVR